MLDLLRHGWGKLEHFQDSSGYTVPVALASIFGTAGPDIELCVFFDYTNHFKLAIFTQLDLSTPLCKRNDTRLVGGNNARTILGRVCTTER